MYIINIKYANAYTEVLEILKYISIEDYNKIPKNKIDLFEINANKDYAFKYNPSKTLEEQNVSKITKGIIAILFRDYWATERQRAIIINKQNNDRMEIEKKKQEKYKPNDIFNNNKKKITIDNVEKEQEKALIEVNDTKWYEKVWRFLKDFFKK